jgi:G:T/U-mismatch repair DNA glycosylase
MEHKFKDYSPSASTEILILGTFHPNIQTSADFFYGRPRNHFWTILPIIFEQTDLYQRPLHEKIGFLHRSKIDVQDIIISLENIPVGQEANYSDEFIDRLIQDWFDTFSLIDSLHSLKAVYFTRKTFQNVPRIKKRVGDIHKHCIEKKIRFCYLETPSRFVNIEKITHWKSTIIDKTICNGN